MADNGFCYLHGKLPGWTGDCPRCSERAYNQADSEGEALAPTLAQAPRYCEVCGREIAYGARCPRCEDDEGCPF